MSKEEDKTEINKKEEIALCESVEGNYRSRLRARSGKSVNRDPNFVYESQLVLEDNYRERSASCSNLTPSKQQLKKAKISKNTKPIDKEGKVNNAPSLGEEWRRKQAQLSQQRIDIFLDKSYKEKSGESDTCLFKSCLNRAATENDLSSIVTHPLSTNLKSADQTSQSSIADSFVSTMEEPLREETIEINDCGDIQGRSGDKKEPDGTYKVKLRSSETLSSNSAGSQDLANTLQPQQLTQQPERLTSQPSMNNTNKNASNEEDVPQDWKTFLLGIKQDWERSMQASINSLKVDFKAGLDELRQGQEDMKTSLQETDKKCKDNETELKAVRSELSTCKLQLKQVTDVAIRRGHEFKECKDKLDRLEKRVYRDVVRIQGIKEGKDEKLGEVVARFFKHKMKIEKEIPILDCYRTGKGTYRTIVIQLQNFRDKGTLFGHVKNLKGVKNDNKRPYQVREHLSPKEFAMKKRQDSLVAKNKRMSTSERLAMKFDKNNLTVDNAVYEKVIKPPNTRQLLQPTVPELTARLSVEVVNGEEVEVENQTFKGFAADCQGYE